MPESASARLGLIGPSSTDLVSSGDDIIRALIARLEVIGAAYAAGTAGARPAAAAGNIGLFYIATDTLVVSVSTGSAWIDINPKDAAAATASLRTLGSGATQAAAGNDPRLSDARTPTAHAASHRPGGSDPLAAIAASAQQVLDVGILNQLRAGRVLTVADFTTLMGLSQPVGLFNLGDLTNLGSGGALVNKGSVPFGTGIRGAASEAAVFAGSTGQALYIVDTGAADPFRIKTGSWGCWARTAKRGLSRTLIHKRSSAAGTFSYAIDVARGVGNVASAQGSLDGSTVVIVDGTTDVADDRWHFIVATHDGTTLRLYVDGVLEASAALAGPLFASNGPFNLGAQSADASNPASSAHYGRIDEAFVTGDVLTADQVRMLYAAKLAHGLSVTPTVATVGVRRRRKGGPLVSGDFPSAPLRIWNFTLGSVEDEIIGATLAVNQGSGVITGGVAGADGAAYGAISFAGAHAGLSRTDDGLPDGLASRSYGLWLKSLTLGSYGIMGWGAPFARISPASDGTIRADSGGDTIIGPTIWDGAWHLVVVVEDDSAADGVKRKLYVDGRLVGGSTVLNSITRQGANWFRIGTSPDGTSPFTGQTDVAFICSYALTPEQILGLYAKGSQALAASPKDAGAHIEGIDATHLYVVADTLESQHQIDLRVAA